MEPNSSALNKSAKQVTLDTYQVLRRGKEIVRKPSVEETRASRSRKRVHVREAARSEVQPAPKGSAGQCRDHKAMSRLYLN
jgi:hypothetical protein